LPEGKLACEAPEAPRIRGRAADSSMSSNKDTPRRPGREAQAPSTFTAFGVRAEATPLALGLHVVATPIGNLGDMTFRGLGVLAAADAILAEDTRVTKTLLAHYGITTPLLPYHEHNAE